MSYPFTSSISKVHHPNRPKRDHAHQATDSPIKFFHTTDAAMGS